MEEHNNLSVLIAMSGGVDSSAAAYLMQAEGFRCQGATMRLLESDDGRNAADAESVCRRLGIPFMTLDMAREFREDVIEKFVRVYRAGGTPNPCVDCNRRMKFSRLMEAADGAGLHYVATGHYARVGRDAGTGRQLLKKALDAGKDQSYFLYTLTQSQLSRVQFPLGGMEKRQVRELAERLGFVNARRRDSQDICFIPGGDYGAFIESWTGEAFPAGDFLDREGRAVGRGASPYAARSSAPPTDGLWRSRPLGRWSWAASWTGRAGPWGGTGERSATPWASGRGWAFLWASPSMSAERTCPPTPSP